MKILDVGCGTAKRKDAIGIDIAPLPGVDIVHDLNSTPWPFEDNEIDKIYMDDILEHLINPLDIIEEVHRILKPGGRLYLRIVHWSHRYSFSDPTHVKYFSDLSFSFFTGEIRPYYTNVRFKLLKLKFIYDGGARKLLRSKRILEWVSKYLINVKQGMMGILEKIESTNDNT